MKVTSVSSPSAIQHTTTNNTAARTRAIEKLSAQPPTPPAAPVAMPAQSPVIDANAVSVEELGALSTTKQADPGAVNDAAQESKLVETPSMEEKPKQDPALTKHFEKLAKQERIFRQKAQQQQEQFKQKEAELKAKEEALAVKEREYQTNYISKQRLKQDTLQTLADAEVSYDELTNQILNQTPRDPRVEAHISRLEAKIADLEQKSQATQKTWEQQQQDSYKTALKQIENDAKALVKQDPKAYEAVAKTNSIKAVVRLIEETYHKDGVLMSVEEAMEEIENHLVDESVKTVSNIEKIKQRIAQATGQTAKPLGQQTQQPITPQPQTMKTLTNAVSSTRKLTSRERAMLAFKGELKP